MRRAMHAVRAVAVAVATAGTALTALPGTASAAVPMLTSADWRMDEPSGATVAVDSSGNGLHGSVNTNAPGSPARIVTGVATDTGLGYQWPAPLRDPVTGLPARDDNRLVLVPDSPLLDPGTVDYAVEIRFRSGALQPNLVQKGQSGTYGGYWKIEIHDGVPKCLMRGMVKPRTSTTAPVYQNQAKGWGSTLTTGVWHTIRCGVVHHTRDAGQDLVLTVDGVSVKSSITAPLGTVDNTWPFAIGGKPFCDSGGTVGCDYFSGLVDYVRVQKAAPNTAPVARIAAPDCTGLDCTFDATGSTDADGDALTYAWRFGDGTTSTAARPTKAYTTGGTYNVSLTVTDARGAGSAASTSVTVAPVPLAWRAGAARSFGSTNVHSVTVPAAVRAGDGLVLVQTSASTAAASAPTGVTGWTAKGQVTGTQGITTRVWSKVASAGDAGKVVRVPIATAAKGDLAVLAYAGTSRTSPVAAVASAAETVVRAQHTGPAVDVAQDGSWVVSYWADRTSATTSWSTSGATPRLQSVNTAAGSGRVSSFVADRGPVAAGTAYGVAATADSPDAKATMLSLVLAPQG